jgi:FAD/FMN-containing dehydrogenase
MALQQWKNWAGNLSVSCNVVRPRSLDELCEVVRRVAASGGRLRAAGGSYSWAPLVLNKDTIVRMDQFDRLLRIDEQTGTVEVECGMRIGALTRTAAAHGMMVVSPTLFPEPTIGGAVAVGAHGTDFANGGIVDRILEMKIVDAEGTVRVVSLEDADIWAAKVALGTLGVIYSVTLQLSPQYHVATDLRVLPVKRVLAEFADLQASCEFLEMFWFPFQQNMWVYLMNLTGAPCDPNGLWTRFKRAVDTRIQSVASQRVIPWLARHAPQLTPVLNSLASRLAFREGFSVQTATNAFHFQHTYAKCWEMEYAVPAAAAERIWRDGIELVEHYAASALHPVNFALHGRFTGASSAWMAPNYGRPTCYIDVTTALGTPHWRDFFGELERKWVTIPGARPHWGKLFYQRDQLATRYEEIDRFLQVRERWDPQRVFLNPFLENEIFHLP